MSSLPRLRGLLALLILLVTVGPATIHGQDVNLTVMAVNGMVVSSHPMASQAGLRILQQGGNAFDAAVAVAATYAVVEPLMSGLGGVGGYAIIYDSETGALRALDFIGNAPQAAKIEMYEQGARLWDQAHPARDGFLAPLVPGNLAGWAALLETYGTMSWQEVFESAIQYAEEGFAVTPAVSGPFGSFGSPAGRYPYGASIFFKNGSPWPVGEVLRQEDLAETLRSIAAGGPSVFYGGALAERFVDYIQANGGLLTVQDFADYEARWSEPISTTYRGYGVFTHRPGSSGMTVVQTLNILGQFDVEALGHNTPEFVHLVAEGMKLAFVDDDAYNNGEAAERVPLDRLLSKEYARQQAARVDMTRARFYPAAVPGGPIEADPETTHHTVIDRDHNVVTITQTSMLQSGVAVPGTGVIFNNGVSYFSLDPDSPDALVGGHRPRFVMSPTIVTRDGEPFFALGSAGGWTIPQTVIQVVVRALDFGMDAFDAVNGPRFTLNYLGNSIPYMEGTDLVLERNGFSEAQREALAELGHRLTEPSGRLGMLNGIMIYPRSGVLSGGLDVRREGQAVGW